MLVQLIQAGSGSLRTEYPALISLLSAFFFPFGLVMLVLTGQELLTAHFSTCSGPELALTTVFMPMALLKRRIKAWQLPLNWLIVFCGNLAGSLCCVAFMGELRRAGCADGRPLLEAVLACSSYALPGCGGRQDVRGLGSLRPPRHRLQLPWYVHATDLLLTSVCTAVWLGATSPDVISKVVALHFPAFMFVFLGFEHVVVNMYYIPVSPW